MNTFEVWVDIVRSKRMSGYIKREDAIRAIMEYIRDGCDESDEFIDGAYKAKLIVEEDIPSADVVEVRHGHWEQEQPQYRLYKCSVCNKVCFVERWGDKTVLYDYCPNCGARMRMTKEQYESHVGDIYKDGEKE